MKQNYFTLKQSRQISKIYNEVQSYMPFEEATFPAFISKIIPFVREYSRYTENSKEYAKEHGAIINPTKFGIVAPKAIMNKDNDEVTSIQRIDFSLSLQQSYAADGKVSIGVLDIGKIEGKYENIKENRVNFSVLITLPCGDTH